MASLIRRDMGGKTRRKRGQVMWFLRTRGSLEEESVCKASGAGARPGHLGKSKEAAVAGPGSTHHLPPQVDIQKGPSDLNLPRPEPSNASALSGRYLGRLPLKSRPSLHSSHTRSLAFAPVNSLFREHLPRHSSGWPPLTAIPKKAIPGTLSCHLSHFLHGRHVISYYLVYVCQPLLSPLSRQELSEGVTLITLLLVRSLGPRTMPST